MAGDGKDGDTDANVWYGGQDSFGTRGYRRSRSQHVVHEEDVFAAQTPGPAHGKDTPYILPPLPVLLERLARIVPVAAHAVDIHRHAEALRNAAGDVFSLIVTAVEALAQVQGDGNDDIHSGIEPPAASSPPYHAPISRACRQRP